MVSDALVLGFGAALWAEVLRIPMVEASVPPIPAIFRKLRRVRGVAGRVSGITERGVEVKKDERTTVMNWHLGG